MSMAALRCNHNTSNSYVSHQPHHPGGRVARQRRENLMSNQRERYEVLRRLEQAGITYTDAVKLRRIALTLHRWHERECGLDNGCIERDEATNKPYWLNSHTMKRYPIPDRERGALSRLADVMIRYRPNLTSYIQGDPRGASLYIVRPSDVPAGANIGSYYNRGIAVY